MAVTFVSISHVAMSSKVFIWVNFYVAGFTDHKKSVPLYRVVILGKKIKSLIKIELQINNQSFLKV